MSGPTGSGLSNSFQTRCMSQGFLLSGAIGANHSCQSSRRWYGLIWQGRRVTGPGLHGNL
jgi:hypothetical protein